MHFRNSEYALRKSQSTILVVHIIFFERAKFIYFKTVNKLLITKEVYLITDQTFNGFFF